MQASELFEPVTAADVETALFCAVVPVYVWAVAAALEVVEALAAVVVLELVEVLAALAAAAALDVDDAVVLAFDAVLAAAALAVDEEVVVAEVLVVEGLDVNVAAAEVDVPSSDAEDEPQPLSAEQQATRPICKPMKTFPNLDTIVTHFRYC